MIIESTDNKTYKYLKGFLNKKQRKKEKIFLVEGIKVIDEALDFSAPAATAVSSKLIDDSDIEEIIQKLNRLNSKVYFIDEKIFDSLSDTEHSQGIISYFDFIHKDSIDNIENGKYVFLDDLKDPGNVGGIIRSAEAFGIKGVILSKETVEIYNPKVIRSTMASVFRMPIYIIDKGELQKAKERFKIVSTAFENSVSIYDYKFDGNIILTIGNEAHGVSDEVFKMSSDFIKIPMTDSINSLNANVAASICMYEMDKYGKTHNQ